MQHGIKEWSSYGGRLVAQCRLRCASVRVAYRHARAAVIAFCLLLLLCFAAPLRPSCDALCPCAQTLLVLPAQSATPFDTRTHTRLLNTTLQDTHLHARSCTRPLLNITHTRTAQHTTPAHQLAVHHSMRPSPLSPLCRLAWLGPDDPPPSSSSSSSAAAVAATASSPAGRFCPRRPSRNLSTRCLCVTRWRSSM